MRRSINVGPGFDEDPPAHSSMPSLIRAHSDAERIMMAMRRPLTVGANEVRATVSIGITTDAPGVSSHQLLRNADLAMYMAKEQGGNRVAQFDDKMQAAFGAVP